MELTRTLPVVLFAIACGSPDGSDTGDHSEEGPASEVVIVDGEVVEVDTADWDRWDVIACKDSRCADITHRFITRDGLLCGPMDDEGIRYLSGSDGQFCEVDGTDYWLEVTLSEG